MRLGGWDAKDDFGLVIMVEHAATVDDTEAFSSAIQPAYEAAEISPSAIRTASLDSRTDCGVSTQMITFDCRDRRARRTSQHNDSLGKLRQIYDLPVGCYQILTRCFSSSQSASDFPTLKAA
jgi:hypothetical protein